MRLPRRYEDAGLVRWTVQPSPGLTIEVTWMKLGTYGGLLYEAGQMTTIHPALALLVHRGLEAAHAAATVAHMEGSGPLRLTFDTESPTDPPTE